MIIVTGASGFIGSCVVARLNEEQQNELILVDHMPDDAKAGNLQGKSYHSYHDKTEFIKLVEENQEKTDFRAAFETMLRDAAADGQLNIDDAQAAAEEFIGLIKSKAFWPVIFGAPVVTPEEMAKIVESSVDMIMARYGA